MITFTEKKFNIPSLKGISQQTIDEHLKLYAGYVKNATLALKAAEQSSATAPEINYAAAEAQRRFSFEYNGIRNHECYFAALEGGHQPLNPTSPLASALILQWGSVEAWQTKFLQLALTRGIGWAMLYYDRQEKKLINAWVDEQHLGQLQNCSLIIALDMWEHSFVHDYLPSGKKPIHRGLHV
jgi:Fe-Mn family superoxide dismutase